MSEDTYVHLLRSSVRMIVAINLIDKYWLLRCQKQENYNRPILYSNTGHLFLS